MKRIYYFSALILMLFTVSCENEMDYKLRSVSPTLTLNGFIYADSLKNKLYLSMTGSERVQEAGEATVTVVVNGEQKEVLAAVKEPDNILRSVEVTTRFRPGDRVRIEARTEDGEHRLWVEEVIPHPVSIERIDTARTTLSVRPYASTETHLRVKVRFHDRPNEKNYYRLVLEQRHVVSGKTVEGKEASSSFKSYNYYPWEDIALTDGRPATSEELETELLERVTNFYGVFHDRWFDNGEYDSWFGNNQYTLNVLIPVSDYIVFTSTDFTPEFWDEELAIRLLSITESEYYYLSTLNVIDSGILDEFLSDPVKMPSNVHGGNGFVGISSENGVVMKLVENGEVVSYND